VIGGLISMHLPFLEETRMATPAPSIFSQLASIAENDLFTAVVPVIGSALADIQANPAQWTNPATAIMKGNAFLADLVATLPNLEAISVTQAAQLVSAVITGLQSKLTATPIPTPAQVGGEIAAAVTPGSIAAS
jgi:hypothetical protein